MLKVYPVNEKKTRDERSIMYNILLRLMAGPEITHTTDQSHLLQRICDYLTQDSHQIVWANYFVLEAPDGPLEQHCTNKTSQGIQLEIPYNPEDPVWRALETNAPIIWQKTEKKPLISWIKQINDPVAEIACLPFGKRNLKAVGVIASSQNGYFEKVGLEYFLAFSHLGDLILYLQEQTFSDPLTGLPNRRLFFDRLITQCKLSDREYRLLGIGIFDLDGFKAINDRLGHLAGDELLKQVSNRVAACLRTSDTLARLGGDEFGLILPNLSYYIEDIEDICERILKALRQPFLINDESAQISTSIGITIYPLDDGDPSILLKHADRALYVAKNEGRDQYRIHTLAMDAEKIYQVSMREKVSEALEQNRLLLFYQPIIHLHEAQQGTIIGVEALLRLDQEDGTLLTPNDMAGALDHPRLARDIGCFVLGSALAQAKQWKNEGLDLSIAVNISPWHLLDSRFISDLESALSTFPGFAKKNLTIEITETAPLQDFELVREVILQCNQLGVQVSLDDFGTGNASLIYLQKLPAQSIKIDRAFVQNIVNNPPDLAIVTAVVMAARMLGMQVIAEGVETTRHAELLRGMSCQTLQGFWIAHPMPASEVKNWIASYKWPHLSDATSQKTIPEGLLNGQTHRVQQFIAALEKKEPFPNHVLEEEAEKHCHLGIWLETEGQQFKHHQNWKQIQKSHRHLHQLSRKAKQFWDQGKSEAALEIASKIKHENHALIGLLTRLEEQKPNLHKYSR